MYDMCFDCQAQNKESGKLAAAKICELKGEDDLDDFTVEIDILADCRHPNVVELLEAFFYDGKLWVLFAKRFIIPFT